VFFVLSYVLKTLEVMNWYVKYQGCGSKFDNFGMELRTETSIRLVLVRKWFCIVADIRQFGR